MKEIKLKTLNFLFFTIKLGKIMTIFLEKFKHNLKYMVERYSLLYLGKNFRECLVLLTHGTGKYVF